MTEQYNDESVEISTPELSVDELGQLVRLLERFQLNHIDIYTFSDRIYKSVNVVLNEAMLVWDNKYQNRA